MKEKENERKENEREKERKRERENERKRKAWCMCICSLHTTTQPCQSASNSYTITRSKPVASRMSSAITSRIEYNVPVRNKKRRIKRNAHAFDSYECRHAHIKTGEQLNNMFTRRERQRTEKTADAIVQRGERMHRRAVADGVFRWLSFCNQLTSRIHVTVKVKDLLRAAWG